ncbi:MAG: hypothetical protein Devi2KO_37680 [Devosia indica]
MSEGKKGKKKLGKSDIYGGFFSPLRCVCVSVTVFNFLAWGCVEKQKRNGEEDLKKPWRKIVFPVKKNTFFELFCGGVERKKMANVGFVEILCRN